jgi:hypothetical protein
MRGLMAMAILAAAMLGFPGMGAAMADCGAKHVVSANASASAASVILPATITKTKTKIGGG